VRKNQRLLQQVRDLEAREVGEDRLWIRPGHFYSPLTREDEVTADAARIFDRAVVELPGIDLRLAEQLELLERCLAMREELDRLPHEEQEDWRYYSDNVYFSYCDAFFLAAILRLFRPRRVIEVGSGFSSSVMLDVDEKYLGRSLRLTFIEPNPERLESLLRRGDARRHRILRSRVQDVPLETFDELQEGDVLFIDSSHVSKTGSDVNHLFFRVVPRLAPGVLVHVHDIFWPFEYAESEVYEGRSWNEAYLVRAFLQYNREFRILLQPSVFAHHPQAGRRLPERCLRPLGPSLWLQRVPAGG
jgi:predicted O-methyltransferase YrrM